MLSPKRRRRNRSAAWTALLGGNTQVDISAHPTLVMHNQTSIAVLNCRGRSVKLALRFES